MGKESIKISAAFMISLIVLLIVAISESASVFGEDKVSCNSVVGVEKGDTCFEIAKAENLSSTDFSVINPNLNCTALFIGQWICISGTVN